MINPQGSWDYSVCASTLTELHPPPTHTHTHSFKPFRPFRLAWFLLLARPVWMAITPSVLSGSRSVWSEPRVYSHTSLNLHAVTFWILCLAYTFRFCLNPAARHVHSSVSLLLSPAEFGMSALGFARAMLRWSLRLVSQAGPRVSGFVSRVALLAERSPVRGLQSSEVGSQRGSQDLSLFFLFFVVSLFMR